MIFNIGLQRFSFIDFTNVHCESYKIKGIIWLQDWERASTPFISLSLSLFAKNIHLTHILSVHKFYTFSNE